MNFGVKGRTWGCTLRIGVGGRSGRVGRRWRILTGGVTGSRQVVTENESGESDESEEFDEEVLEEIKEFYVKAKEIEEEEEGEGFLYFFSLLFFL